MSRSSFEVPSLTRRRFLAASVLGGASLAACGSPSNPTSDTELAGAQGDKTLAELIAAAEAARPRTGKTSASTLRAAAADIDLGGTVVPTLAYNGQVPGPLLRANVGDEFVVSLNNALDHPSSVHWHGIALRNDMDGAAPASADVKPGQSFTYRFTAPHPGTHWAHPHAGGLDTDYGMYLPVIVDDPAEPGDYDAEWIVMLDDWTSGVGRDPRQIFAELRSGGMAGHGSMPGMPGMGSMGGPPGSGNDPRSDLLGGDSGDVEYPYFLVNGRIPKAATTFDAKPGQRIRIRMINAAADTAFRVALAEHRMTVTHTDGFPVVPTDVDAVLVGMGERYDVVVTAGDGVFALVASAEGKNGQARALLRTGSGGAPEVGFQPPELAGRIGTAETFTAADEVSLPAGGHDVALQALLTGSMMDYNWMINGRTFDRAVPLTVRQGEHATITFTNHTMMWHPMHLHGHTFQVIKPDGEPGPRKDTVIVNPMQSVAVRLVADNPGVWMLHCHNGYHMEAGMMTTLDYVI